MSSNHFASREALSELLRIRSGEGLAIAETWRTIESLQLTVLIVETVGVRGGEVAKMIAGRLERMARDVRVAGLETQSVGIDDLRRGDAVHEPPVLATAACAVVLSPADAPFGRDELAAVALCDRHDVDWMLVVCDASAASDFLASGVKAARRARLDDRTIARLQNGALVVVDTSVDQHCFERVTTWMVAHLPAGIERRMHRAIQSVATQTLTDLEDCARSWRTRAQRIEQLGELRRLVEQHLRTQADMEVSRLRMEVEELARRVRRVEEGDEFPEEDHALSERDAAAMVSSMMDGGAFHRLLAAEAQRFGETFPEFTGLPTDVAIDTSTEFIAGVESTLHAVSLRRIDADTGAARLLQVFDRCAAPAFRSACHQGVDAFVHEIDHRMTKLVKEAIGTAEKREASQQAVRAILNDSGWPVSGR